MKDVIELAEKHAHAAAQFSLAGLDEARKRGHALLLLLTAGGASAAALGLARYESSPALAAAAMCTGVLWFALAAYVAWSANTTADVRSWATRDVLGALPAWQRYADDLVRESEGGPLPPDADVATALRMSLLRNCELATSEYRAASLAAFRVIDRAYKLAACTPLPAAICAAVVAVVCPVA